MSFALSRRLAAAGLVLALAACGGIGAALAQTAGQPAAPRPVFCIANQMAGTPVIAEIRAGAATTKVQLPANQQGCCVKFCADNPSPAGYQVAVLAGAAGAAPHQVCKATVTRDQVLEISGTATQTKCTTGKLQ